MSSETYYEMNTKEQEQLQLLLQKQQHTNGEDTSSSGGGGGQNQTASAEATNDGGDSSSAADLNKHQQSFVNAFASRQWKISKPKDAIVIAVSSRVLFDMSEQKKIDDEQGLEAFLEHMQCNQNKPLKPGAAFDFIHALGRVNLKLLELNPLEKELFDVVLMSKNSAQCGISLISSVNHHKLTIERFCLTAGTNVSGYLAAFGTDLYLSQNKVGVADAIDRGIAAAMLFTDSSTCESDGLRIAFDGDAVLFSDESERVAKESGLQGFFENEEKKAFEPLGVGPLKNFAIKIGEMQKKFKNTVVKCPIRTYLVTARSGASSGIRALKTLQTWGLEIDELQFMSGAPKGPILEKIKPHLFFDDQMRNVESGLEHGVNSALVPYGIARDLDD